MTDIIERLRNLARNYADGVAGMEPQDHFAWDAADEIERLRAQVKELQESCYGRYIELEQLRAVKTPASAQLLNITKAALDDAETENKRLHELLQRWTPKI